MGYWRDRELEASAHASCIIDIMEEMVENADDDDPIDFYGHIIGVCQALMSIYEPEGEPEEGYPSEKILNLERERAKRRLS